MRELHVPRVRGHHSLIDQPTDHRPAQLALPQFIARGPAPGVLRPLPRVREAQRDPLARSLLLRAQRREHGLRVLLKRAFHLSHGLVRLDAQTSMHPRMPQPLQRVLQ